MSTELISACHDLIDAPDLAPLGPGPRASVTAIGDLNQQVDDVFNRHGSPRKAGLVRSLLLLWHDHLEPSHVISQGEHNPDGSLVHAIMHRREPDYSNAKYWWRSTGDHSCFPAIVEKVEPLVTVDPDLASLIVPGGTWDPYGFTDAVACGIRKPESSDRHQLLLQIQKVETEAVLEFLVG